MIENKNGYLNENVKNQQPQQQKRKHTKRTEKTQTSHIGAGRITRWVLAYTKCVYCPARNTSIGPDHFNICFVSLLLLSFQFLTRWLFPIFAHRPSGRFSCGLEHHRAPLIRICLWTEFVDGVDRFHAPFILTFVHVENSLLVPLFGEHIAPRIYLCDRHCAALNGVNASGEMWAGSGKGGGEGWRALADEDREERERDVLTYSEISSALFDWMISTFGLTQTPFYQESVGICECVR